MNNKICVDEIKLLSINNRFINISYCALEEKKGPHSVSIDDEIDSVEVNNDVVTLVYKRKINVDDKSMFAIDIRVESNIKFKKDDSISDLEYKKFFKEHYMYYYRNTSVASTISLIVGQITAAFGRSPLLVAFKD